MSYNNDLQSNNEELAEILRTVNELPEAPEVPAGNYIPVPSVAEVGQTIVVTAVDENGVPTAWEAADLPSGGAWKKVYECGDTEVTEAVASVEIDLGVEELGEIEEYAIQLYLSKSTLETTCNGQINFELDGMWIGYYCFGMNLSANPAHIDLQANITTGALTFIKHTVSQEFNAANHLYIRRVDAHTKSERNGKLKIKFPAEWAGTYNVKVFTK